MFRLPNNFLFLFHITVLCFIVFACGFVDFRPIKYTIEPKGYEVILETINSPIIISFDTKMIKEDVENIFQVSSESGPVKGDFFWEDDTLYFMPVTSWTAGIRYTININGTVNSIDGRELKIQHYSTFYAVNNNPSPVIESYYPIENQSIPISDFNLIINFSRSMDRLSVESAISIDGISNKKYEWLNEDKTIRIYSDKDLSAWTNYKWTIKDSAKSVDGVPLAKQYSSSFITNLDQEFPHVLRVYPVKFLDGSWIATGAHIETGLKLGDAIAIEFNKPVSESSLRSVRFEPSLAGRTELLSENKIVYIFSGNLEPETVYTMIVSADTRDTEGLKIGNDYRISFLTDIPYLTILTITDDMKNLDSGIISISIRLSFQLNNEEKLLAVQKINLSPYFPKTLSPIALQYVNWVSNDLVVMRWEGLKAGSEETEHYYKLTIPGGKNGIVADGLYMKDNETIYLKAETITIENDDDFYEEENDE